MGVEEARVVAFGEKNGAENSPKTTVIDDKPRQVCGDEHRITEIGKQRKGEK